MRIRVCTVIAALVVATVGLPAFAQVAMPVQREVPLAATPGEVDYLRTVPLPPGRAAVVSDVAGVLAVIHKQGKIPGPHVSLVRLDDRGEPSKDKPVTIQLPHSKLLTDRDNYPLALTVHPKLPLLYVWQDVVTSFEKGAPVDDPKADGFCHLHVYDISKPEPQLLQSVAQGDTFARGNTAGAIEFDRHATRLFVPNLQRRNAKGVATASIGFLRVLENGHVVPDDDDVLAAASSGKAGVDRQADVTAAARKAYLEQVRTGKVLDRATRNATSASAIFAAHPCGLSYFNVSDTVTIVGGPLGPVTWDESNRRAQFNAITFYPIVGIGYRLRLVGHPTLPVIFVSGLSSGFVYRMEHVDGFLTMLPQRGTLAGVTAIASSPVLLGKRPYFACGSAKTLHLIGFDDQGHLNGQRIDVPVVSDTVEAIAYSPRFDKLYTRVDEAKK